MWRGAAPALLCCDSAVTCNMRKPNDVSSSFPAATAATAESVSQSVCHLGAEYTAAVSFSILWMAADRNEYSTELQGED